MVANNMSIKTGRTSGSVTIRNTGNANEYVVIDDKNGNWLFGFRQNGEKMKLEMEANAEFITRAWNAHDVMLEACQTALDNLAPLYASDHLVIQRLRAAIAKGKFTLRDAPDLRHKESDRISALVKNLRAMEVEVEEYPDGFAFENKNPLIGAKIDSIQDHRIAMAFGVAGLAASGETVIQDAECVDISFPGFWQILQRIRN
ncbi:MAG: hypothetical protein HY276_05275 [Ignavibacteriales bacterium]|nr:hypothetical protein [Ignavibacteriales bacterium]